MVKLSNAARPVESLKALLADLLKGYSFEVVGLHLKDGTILPLPADPAVLREVLQTSIVDHLRRQLRDVRGLGLGIRRRWGCLQLVFGGSLFSSDSIGVDVRCARRSARRGATQSAITLGAPGSMSSMTPVGTQHPAGRVMIIALYDFVEGGIRGVELIVVEKWRVAGRHSRTVASRGMHAIRNLGRLRAERGDFENEQEFRAFVHGLEDGRSDRCRATAGAGGGR